MTLLPALLPAGAGTPGPPPPPPPLPPFPPATTNFTLQVEVAFNDDVWAPSPTWTDITKYVKSVKTTLGRQHELQQVNPSTAAIVLTNQPVSAADPGGRFSPWNTGSPYYGSGSSLTAGHPMRVRATVSSVTYDVFYGYTHSWVPAYGQSSSDVTLNGYDALALLNLALVDTSSIYDTQITTDGAEAYWTCQDQVNSRTFADATGHGHTATLAGVAAFGSTAGTLISGDSSCTFKHGGYMATPIGPSSNASVTFEGWFNTKSASQTLMGWPFLSYGGGLYGTWAGIDADGLPGLFAGVIDGQIDVTIALGDTPITDGAWHHIAVIVPCTDPTATWSLYVDGGLVGSQPAVLTGSSLLFTFDDKTFTAAGTWVQYYTAIVQAATYTGSIDRLAYYTSALSADQIANHFQLGSAGYVVQDSGARTTALLDAVGIPGALQNILAGNITVQGSTSSLATSSVMSYLQRVVNTERGLLYQDASGVIQFKNREYVYENTSSVMPQATLTYHPSAGVPYMSTGMVPQSDDVDLWNDIPVSRSGGAIQYASDATSIAAYGRRSLQGYTSLLFQYDQDAADLASGLLYQYKNPAPRVRAITLDSTINSGATLPTQLGLDLLDRVTVVWKPIDGSTVDFDQQSLIEQVTHTIVPGQWTTTFSVTPIGTEQFFIFDDPVNGLLDVSPLGF